MELSISAVVKLTAHFISLDSNGQVTYSLTGGVNSSRPEFGVFPDGTLYVAQRLDRESKDRFELIVEAVDRGMPTPRTSSTVVHVKVLDNNDNAPVFSSNNYEFRVLEGKEKGTYIG